MTVTNTTPRADYVGSGSVSAYDFDFPVASTSELAVYTTDTAGVVTPLYLSTGFTAVLNGDGSGTITLVAGNLTTDYLLAIVRASVLDQQTDFTARTVVTTANAQTSADRLARQLQEVNEKHKGSIRIHPSEDPDDFNMVLPAKADRALRTFGFDSDGNVMAGVSIGGASVSAYGETLIDDADAAAARSTLGISAAMDPVVTSSTLAAAISAMGPWGTALVTPTGASSSSSLANRFARAVSPEDFGAVADGTTDDTSAINAAIASGIRVVDGNNKLYLVTTVIMASNSCLRNIKLKEKADASAVSLKPVVKIGDDVNAISNVVLQNVIIDGNRQNLANVNMGAGEDGGMHGIRIGGLATNVWILDCQANYCGTAGLAIHNEIPIVGTATYPIKRIYVENFVAEYNREHGMFADSVDGLYVNGAVLNNNGQTLTGALPDTDGRTGAKAAGALFGAGFDIETYVGYASSYVKNVNFNNVVAKGNSQGCLLYIPSVVDAVVDIPCQNINLSNCDFDKSTLGVNFYGLKLFANSAVGAKYGIDGVTISGRMNGHVDANNTKGVTYTSGWIESDTTITYKAVVNNSDDFIVTCPSNRNNILVQTFSALGVVKNNGAGTWAPTVSQTVLANGVHKLQIDANITGGTIAGGDMAWTLTLPTGVVLTAGSVNGYNTTTWKTTPTHVACLTATTCQVFVTPTDDTVTVQLRLDVTF